MTKHTYLKTYSSREEATKAAEAYSKSAGGKAFAVRRDNREYLACPLDDRGYDSQGVLVEIIGTVQK